MPRINPLTETTTSPEAKEIFVQLKKSLGKVPNIYATMAHSPTTLKGMLAYGVALKKGVFSSKEVEAIGLAVGQENNCNYCLAAHTLMGKGAGWSEEETHSIRLGNPADKKIKALTDLAREIVRSKGLPAQESIDAFLAAGYNQAALVELIAWVAHNIFTNYFNHIAETEVDFPPAKEI